MRAIPIEEARRRGLVDNEGEADLLLPEGDERQPYPLDVLPQIMRAAVLEYQHHGQQPIEMVATAALASAATVVQGLVNVARDEVLVGPISLSFLQVAKSGERKSACDQAMGAVLKTWAREAAKRQEEGHKRAKLALEAHQLRERGLKKRIEAAAQKGDGEEARIAEKELQQLGPAPWVPPLPRLVLEDCTSEAVIKVLATGWPSATLTSDEAALVVGGHGMSEDTALRFLGLLNRLWDGGDVHRDRSTSESFVVRGRRLTVNLMAQPHVVEQLMKVKGGAARGIGALARFLFSWPSSTMGSRFYRPPVSGGPARAAWNRRIYELLERDLPTNERGELEPPSLTLSPEAYTAWRAYHDDVEQELIGRFDECTDFAAKSAENAARIAAVLHVIECGPEVREISESHVEAGCRLALWYLMEARRAFEVIGTPVEFSNAEKLLQWLKAQPDRRALIRDISKSGPRAIRKKPDRDRAIEQLVAENRIRRSTVGQTYVEVVDGA